MMANKNRKDHYRSISEASLITSVCRLLLRIFSSLNRLKYLTGQCSSRARLEFSQFLISGIAAKRCLRAISLANLPTPSGKTDSSKFKSSQMRKSITVRQPQYQPTCGHSCSQSLRMGSSLLAQQQLRLFFSSGEREGRAEQMSPRTAPLRSCLLLMLSILTLSVRVLPKRSVRPARSTTQLTIAAGPVTTKSSSLRKGRSRTTQSAAYPSLNLFHWSGVKN